MSGINNLFIGAENAESFFIGSQECELIYLGNEIVYQKGDFSGLKMKYKVTMGKESGSTYYLKIKSSEAWTLSVETAATWLNFSQLSGDSGETIVTIECNEENQTGSARTTTITATTNSFSATCEITQIDVRYVPYIHTDTLTANTNVYIDTGVFPTSATTMRVKYVGKNMTSSAKYFGFSWYAEEDKYNTAPQNGYRMFYANGHIYWDYNGSRVENGNVNPAQNGVFYDYTLGNNYIYDNLTETTIGSGEIQNDPYQNIPIMANISCIWLQSIEIWDGQTLVFDGQAAVDDANNIIGLYDSVSNDWYYNSAVTMTYEENDVQINWTNTGDVYTAEVSAILVDDFRICQLKDTYVPTPFQPMHAYYEVWLTTANTVVVKALGNAQWNVVATLGSNETFTNNYGLSITNQMFIDEILVEAVDTVYNGVSHEWSWKYRYTSDNGGNNGGGDIGGEEEE